MIALADRDLTDDKLDHQRAAVAGALWFKAEQISAPRQRVELTGSKGRPIQMDDGPQSLAVIARKVALAFRIAAEHGEKAGLIEDAGDGRDALLEPTRHSDIAFACDTSRYHCARISTSPRAAAHRYTENG